VVIGERAVAPGSTTKGHCDGIHLHWKQGTIGGTGAKQGATKGGNRGEWSDVRPRRGKAPEQVDDGRDRLWEDQRQGGTRRHRQSRVRARYESPWQDYVSEDSREFREPILSKDGRLIMQFSRHDLLAGAARN